MSNFSNILSVAFRSILKNKRRNIFTMIGIIIGIAAVITIMALGNGFKKTTNEQFDDAGAGKDQAMITYMTEDMSAPKDNPFKQEDLSVVEQVKGVKSAKVKESKDSTYAAKITNTHGSGDVDLKKASHVSDVDHGHGFTKDDNDTQEKVVVIDNKVAKKVFHNADSAVGKSIYINGEGFKVVGVGDASGQDASGMPLETVVQMPTKTADHYMSNLSQGTPQIQVKVNDGEDKKEIGKKVEKELNKKGTGVSNGQYSFNDNEEMMKSIGKVLDTITYFVAAVAGISLFIAGIGVMNVMYISVTERTEEIAIRRAFGAKGRDIEIQFLVESVVLCLLGGIIGLILGIIIATVVDMVTPDMVKSSVSISSVILAVGVSTLIGVVFGWIPARAASKKELIDIIK
ncbi:ABC transporter permease [Staphylococcus pasteuri]|uniref:ABC transporter permease n=1 Tax=Staphylococcus pasteuri TaxID=45972 RepID=UPI000F835BD6|nr:ABC transporter permease [Staphylococcus pasteuri]MCD9066871.1 ABC transporter permease [Staphylococcus pasteuri]MEB6612527.1 ABC transporter permease [Staphylococcus pasteuri]QQN54067.1 ABC transporter permease [Staphylococcus pasteuri]RTX76066.1 FtsX-like permease family protein [Staphylococcus pasteuri]WAE41753.1 ABC transporter permease [Staphylococcus pasteuri]